MLRFDLDSLLSRVRSQLLECRNALEKGLEKKRLLEAMIENIQRTMRQVEQNVEDNQQAIRRQLDQLDPRLKFLQEYRQKVIGTLHDAGVQSAIAQGWSDLERTRNETERMSRAVAEMSETVRDLESEELRLEQQSGLGDEDLEGMALSAREDLFALARAGLEKLL